MPGNFGEKKRADYLQLAAEAQGLKGRVNATTTNRRGEKLMEDFHMDPTGLKRPSIVAEASSAIQKAAQAGVFQVGPIRESARALLGQRTGHPFNFEGAGPVKERGPVASLQSPVIHCIIDSTQISADPARPGQLKLKLTVIILDFEQWKIARRRPRPDQTAKLFENRLLILAALYLSARARLVTANPLARVVIPRARAWPRKKNASAPAGGAATNSVNSVSNGTNKPATLRGQIPPLNSTNGNASNLIAGPKLQ